MRRTHRTPAPWNFESEQDGEIVKFPSLGMELIGYDADEAKTNLANAHLIRAALDLEFTAELAFMLMQVVSPLLKGAEMESEWRACLDLLSNALKKAKGRA